MNFIDSVDRDTRIIDIPNEDIGIIIGIQNSIIKIPDNLLNLIRSIYKNLILTTEDELLTNEEKALAWKKLYLLPTLLFTHKKGSDIKRNMKERLNKIVRNQWEDFTLGSLAMRPAVEKRTISQEIKLKRVDTFIQAGRLSAAYNHLISPTMEIVPPDREKFDLLRQKFPEQHDGGLDVIQEERLLNYSAKERGIRSDIKVDQLGDIIHSLKPCTSHGNDHFRHEHIRQLWNYKTGNINQDEFRAAYTRHIIRIMNAELPQEVIPLYADSEAIAIPKDGGDIRPIGKVGLERKIAAKSLLKLHQNRINDTFKGLQYGSDKLGCEKIIHHLRVTRELHPDYDCWCPDGKNAFNNSNRRRGLLETIENIPYMFSFLNMIYGRKSTLWYFGLEDGIQNISSVEGSQQGCNLGNLLCGLAFLGLVSSISEILNGVGWTKFYVDDGNVCTTFEKMISVIEFVTQEGSRFGYTLQTQKGAYLMAECGSMQTALERKNRLIQAGLAEHVIHIHPNDYVRNSEEELQELNIIEEAKLAKQMYGAKVLGAFIGHDDYVKKCLNEKYVSLCNESQKLLKVESVQNRNLLLRWCYGEKISYILRTTSPRLTIEFAKQFNVLKHQVLQSMLNQFSINEIPRSIITQASFNLKDGGLGLKDSVIIAHVAFTASMIDCSEEISQLHPEFLRLNIPIINNLNDAIRFIAEKSEREYLNVDVIKQLKVGKAQDGNADGEDEEEKNMNLQRKLSKLIDEIRIRKFKETIDNKHLAWFTSIADSCASTFLTVIPKCKSLQFSSHEMRALLNHRLYLPQPE
jgi:hypothetical protein